MTQKHIALDTETTGIGPGIHRLIEIAAIEFDPESGLPTGNTYYTLINPEREVPAEATAVHGKSLEDLKDAPLFADVADDLLAFVEGAHVVIHNAPFDVGFLEAELKTAKRKTLAKTIGALTDTLAQSRRHVRAKVHTLDALCDRYGVDRSKRTLHGALIDCEMLAAVYPKLMHEVRGLREQLNGVLPFNIDAPLPNALEEVVLQHLHMAELIKLLEGEQKARTDAIKKAVAGLPQNGDFFTVDFTERTTTDWERITREHLAGIDLAPYRKGSSAMYVRHK
jgi:DNA polymerase III subunit epsilon